MNRNQFNAVRDFADTVDAEYLQLSLARMMAKSFPHMEEGQQMEGFKAFLEFHQNSAQTSHFFSPASHNFCTLLLGDGKILETLKRENPDNAHEAVTRLTESAMFKNWEKEYGSWGNFQEFSARLLPFAPQGMEISNMSLLGQVVARNAGRPNTTMPRGLVVMHTPPENAACLYVVDKGMYPIDAMRLHWDANQLQGKSYDGTQRMELVHFFKRAAHGHLANSEPAASLMKEALKMIGPVVA